MIEDPEELESMLEADSESPRKMARTQRKRLNITLPDGRHSTIFLLNGATLKGAQRSVEALEGISGGSLYYNGHLADITEKVDLLPNFARLEYKLKSS